MTLTAEIYEMNYACSPGGVDCWEATVRKGYESVCFSDFKNAGKALNYVIDKYPNEVLNLTVMSLPAYEKTMTSYVD
jgi:hypothetical protein